MYKEAVTNTTNLGAATAITKGKFIVLNILFPLRKVKKTNSEFNFLFRKRKKRQVKVRRGDESINIQIRRQQVFFCGPIIKTRKHTNPRKPSPADRKEPELPRPRLRLHLVGPQAPPSGSHTWGRLPRISVPGREGPPLRPPPSVRRPELTPTALGPGDGPQAPGAPHLRWAGPRAGAQLPQRLLPPPPPILRVLQVSSPLFPRSS